ncbi:MAG: hypothetical protein ACYS22_16225, partial [Planctomycetota bacterium]
TITTPNQSGTPSQPIVTQPRVQTVAIYPIPIEKRRFAGFLWQRSPFDLDSNIPPTHQEPRADMLLPYWVARSHGLIP